MQNQLPSPTSSPYMCRQRNSTRNGNDLESGSLLEPITGTVGSGGTNTKDSNGEIV